jgi:hypothetical protein
MPVVAGKHATTDFPYTLTAWRQACKIRHSEER